MKLNVWSGLTLLSVVGCSERVYLDRGAFNSNIGKYSVLPGNKAMYIQTDTMRINYVWSAPDARGAISRAQIDCVRDAVAAKVSTQKCIPIAVNDKQVL